MSITFRLDKPLPKIVYSKCPTCGVSNGPEDDSRRYDMGQCPECYGFGPDIPQSPFELNVSNDNAFYILSGILNESSEDYCGSFTPGYILLRLAMFFNPQEGVREQHEEQGVYIDENGVVPSVKMVFCGRTLGQIERYAEKLKLIAEKAIEEEVNVVWG